MNKIALYGHLVFALDGLFIEGQGITDEQRDILMKHFKQSLEFRDEIEATQYYIEHSNTNIKL